MKLSEYANVYAEFSGKASDVARQLAFAGLALVWLFRESNGPVPTYSRPSSDAGGASGGGANGRSSAIRRGHCYLGSISPFP